ncbi:MAG: hypothetical protein RSD41_06850 [Kiritimatiellia bacterium]
MGKNEPKSYFSWQRHSFTGSRWPHNRVVRSFLLMVPWIDLVVAGMLVFLIGQQTIVQPGRVVELPQAPMSDGLLARCPTAVIRRLVAPGRAECTVLLLDEGRYSSDNPLELEALAQTHPGPELNLVVDKAVPYGEALAWVERLRACGTERVNLVETVVETGN